MGFLEVNSPLRKLFQRREQSKPLLFSHWVTIKGFSFLLLPYTTLQSKSLQCLSYSSFLPLCPYWLHQVPANEWMEKPSSMYPFPFQLMAEIQRVQVTFKRRQKDQSVWIPALLIMWIDCQTDCNLRQSSSSALPSTLVWHGQPQPAQNQSALRYGQQSQQWPILACTAPP